ncbi:type II toxin-antitoxin system VapC family toxin [Leptospira dzoumogneensis]|uniref:Type II toxin-antitoxin system VapC family toxin n=1 Tax=Leptospira dzoumogneensis TaxID=2484904 RepID=A0A4Z1A9V4_9LEPT|nr:type II toxin-antitoxin system VapC family toxin [Leptospira dzoumogneensis]TGM97392.1 type II toxin-antitoxin system VapC family toxin [Leptospira dzoumogneensis]
MVLLDTHIWIWWVSGSDQLKPAERQILDCLSEPPAIAAVSLWELSLLFQLDRISLNLPIFEWLDLATRPSLVQIIDCSPEVAKELIKLPTDMHRDPADRMILATAKANDLDLITRDKILDRFAKMDSLRIQNL